MRHAHGGSAVLLCLIAVVSLGSPVYAQRTDIVSLRNGDHITGEVIKLDRGQLEFKTDDEGTIYFEWDIVASVLAAGQFEVVTTDGRRFLGSLAPDVIGSIKIVTATGPVSLTSDEITLITQIGESFWKKLEGSIDIGFSYTHSSGIAQLNANGVTNYRRPSFEAAISASGTFIKEKGDDSKDDRAILQASYIRYRGQKLFVAAAASFETNQSLGIELRSLLAGSIGARLVNTNRAQVSMGGGLTVNDERGVDSEPTQNIEGLLTFRTSYFTYDRPKTNIDTSFQYYPSLSDFGRQRIQFNWAFKREVWKDVFFSVNGFDSFDSRPPDPAAEKNDVGIVLSFGWSW
jgi:uncharacterized protein DUF481